MTTGDNVTAFNPKTDIVKINTPRGAITIGPRGKLAGLWGVCKRELLTNEQIRKLAGGIERGTLLRWRRHREFPGPVLTFKSHGGKLELWSRTQVEAWLAARDD